MRKGVAGTKYTLPEIEKSLRERREVIRKLEDQAEQCYKREQKYIDRKNQSTGIRKQTATLDAKSAQRERMRYEKLHRNLSLQQLFLRNLVEHVKEKRFAENPMQELGLSGVDIQAMNTEAVVDALSESSTELDEPIPNGLEKMQWALENANENTLMPDLDRLKDGYWSSDSEEMDGEYTPNAELDEMLDDMVDEMVESGNGAMNREPERDDFTGD